MKEPAFNFQHLDPDTILDALWETGIRVESGLTALNSYENRVYQFSDEDKTRYVVKFYRPQRWSQQQILEEHQFTAELFADEVPVERRCNYREKPSISIMVTCTPYSLAWGVVSMKRTIMIIWNG